MEFLKLFNLKNKKKSHSLNRIKKLSIEVKIKNIYLECKYKGRKSKCKHYYIDNKFIEESFSLKQNN